MDELDLDERRIAIADLTPDPANARVHDQRNIDAIAHSLATFGQTKRIVVSQDLVVVAGNGTVTAALQLGWTHINIVVLPWTDPEKCLAYALEDNRTAELARWDGEILAGHLKTLEGAGWAVADLGWNGREYNRLLPMPIIEDLPPEPPANPITQLGDVLVLGRHRLLVGDAGDAAAVESMAGRCDMLWTDPPYGVEYVGKTRRELTIHNDNMAALQQTLRSAFGSASLVLEPGAPVYVSYATRATLHFWGAFEHAGWTVRQELIWVKDRFVLGHDDYHWQHEPILYGFVPGEGRRGRGGHGWFGDDAQSTVLQIPRPSSSEDHPTMKPVELVAACIVNSTPPAGVVLDLFAGSGSTLMAAEQTGRSARVVELDPRYADVIATRWQAHAGELPILERTGESIDFVGSRDG